MCHISSSKVKTQALANPAKRAAKPFEPWATSPALRRVMQSNKSRDTKPEMAVCGSCHGYALSCRGAPTY